MIKQITNLVPIGRTALVLDMDGVLAHFEVPNATKRMYEKGFFRKLRPYWFTTVLAQFARAQQISLEDIFILSSCIDSPYCKDEKRGWINQYLSYVKDKNIVLINEGENKKEKFISYIGRNKKYDTYALIDDYGENLRAWQHQTNLEFWDGRLKARTLPVKAFNPVNGTKRKKYPYFMKVGGIV